MFATLFKRAEASVDNAIGDLGNRVVIAIPFLTALGFGTAGVSLMVNRIYGVVGDPGTEEGAASPDIPELAPVLDEAPTFGFVEEPGVSAAVGFWLNCALAPPSIRRRRRLGAVTSMRLCSAGNMPVDDGGGAVGPLVIKSGPGGFARVTDC